MAENETTMLELAAFATIKEIGKDTPGVEEAFDPASIELLIKAITALIQGCKSETPETMQRKAAIAANNKPGLFGRLQKFLILQGLRDSMRQKFAHFNGRDFRDNVVAGSVAACAKADADDFAAVVAEARAKRAE